MGDEKAVPFSVLCSMYNWMAKSKSSSKKRSKFRKFLDNYCKSPSDYFNSIRLILPSLDRERGSYGLKESVLATCLIDALGISRESEDAVRLINWRKGGAKTGVNVGNFALVASEVLQRRQSLSSGGLTILELNVLLDRLSATENRAEKTGVLAELIKKTNAQEMKWIVMIILKDLKLGTSEKSIFHEFHPDAEDLFNVTCDLKLVCEKLRDRSKRHKRQDIEIGKAVRPQLALRISDAAAAWKKLHGKEVVVECKFDGDRIQIHKSGAEIHFFSRNFLDHPEYEHAMSNIIKENILVDRCILDGEMLVWDTSTNRFAEFGSNQEIAKDAKQGFDSDRQIWSDVAFDILYVGDTSVIHQSLKERHELLRKVVKPSKGRLEILVPNGGLNAHRPPGEPCWSLIAYNVEEVQKFFNETIENRDEGIVLKDLGSKWEPSDRNGKWLKLKPDYIRAGSDLDVAQFLVGLAERSVPNIYPRRFISFCRVGTGLSDDELDALVTKLKPYFRKNEYPKRTPSFYEVTNNSKERPEVWIESPEKSIILSITSDIRTIRSEAFAAPYCLRFPRIDRVRYDKPWHECLDVQSFVDLVHSSNGNTQRGTGYGDFQENKPKRIKTSSKGDKKIFSVVPSHFIKTDVSGVKEATCMFANMMFYFINVPPNHSLDSFHKMVAENGGSFSMNLNDSVTHCIAAERKGIKYQAAKLRRDIIHYSWVLDCCSQKRLLHLQPKYFLFLADSSKTKLQSELDEFSDSYFWDLDLMDIKQLLKNIDRLEDCKTIDYYTRKYCPKEKCQFQDCQIYFHLLHPLNTDWEILLELALKRMKLEVSMHGGEISNKLAHATHLVVLSVPGSDVDVETFFKSLSVSDRRLLHSKRFYVVQYQWLEDSFEKDRKLNEDAYSLKLDELEESNTEISKHVLETLSSIDDAERENISASPVKDVERSGGKPAVQEHRISTFSERNRKRKRGRPTQANMETRTNMKRRNIRGRPGHRAAKIDENEIEKSASSDDALHKDEVGSSGIHKRILEEDVGTKGNKGPVSIDTLHGDEAAEWSDKVDTTDLGGGNNSQYTEMAERSASVHEIEREVKKNASEKLEVMVDPLEAMLLDMIPSLGVEKPETTNPVFEGKKPCIDPVLEQGKKKKVSYKDVVGELLKDW
ncbi:hypothetical protein IFM89_004673 [Coptis chinensis]|uniref:DNA ligase n=1 Tax=Coptis chinensis TaxID=261450 RepID=A0A835LZ65_9MAGN|nr:hypothetical protein IFM89_004673 [Coptis chinensis]